MNKHSLPPHLTDLINTICDHETVKFSDIIKEIDTFLYESHPQSQREIKEILDACSLSHPNLTSEELFVCFSPERLNNVIKALCENEDMTQEKIVQEIRIDLRNNHPSNTIPFSIDILKKIKTKKTISCWILDAFQRRFNINPDYIRASSTEMYYKAGITYNCFSKIFPDWQPINAPYMDENGTQHMDRYLLLTADSNFYNFLMKADAARYKTSEDLTTFNQSLLEYEQEFNNQNTLSYKEYVLLPTEDLDNRLQIAIAEDAKFPHDILEFEEIIDLDKHYSFLSRKQNSEK